MRLVTLATILGIILPVSLLGQTSKIVVIDFERAVVESMEGKKAVDAFNAKFEERRKEFDKQQQELQQLENTLSTQQRALSQARTLEISRDIDQRRTSLARSIEDAEKEFANLRDQLLPPVAENASVLLRAYAYEQDFTLVIDISAPETNVLAVSEAADITTAFIQKLDEETAKKAQARP